MSNITILYKNLNTKLWCNLSFSLNITKRCLVPRMEWIKNHDSEFYLRLSVLFPSRTLVQQLTIQSEKVKNDVTWNSIEIRSK